MRPVNFTYTLDVVFREGVDHNLCKMERKEGKDITRHYSPKATGVYVSWSLDNKYYKQAVYQKAFPQFWDFNLKLPSKKHPNYLELNVMLSSILSRIRKEYMNMRSNELAITPGSIRDMVRDVINGPVDNGGCKKDLFWTAFDEFLEEKKQLMKPATIVKYQSWKKTMLAFEKTMDYPLTFESINARFYTKFMIYSTGPDVAHKANHIGKNFSMMKCFMNHSYEMKYHRYLDFKRFRCGSETTDPVFLTRQELAEIEQYDAGADNTLSWSKDIFLMGCFSGSRISDIMALKVRDLKLLPNGCMEWHLHQLKGRRAKMVRIYMVTPARLLLEKYLVGKGGDQFVFPRISPVVVNRKLKVLGEKVGLRSIVTKINWSGKNRIERTGEKSTFLTTHVGRKTFVSLLCAGNLLDHEIQDLTGHASRAIKVYKGIDRSRVVDGLKRVFEQNEFDKH